MSGSAEHEDNVFFDTEPTGGENGGDRICSRFSPLFSVSDGRGGCSTGGKGSITQWVHAEYMEGSETIRPAFTQWVRGGYFSKVPTKVPTG